VAGSTAPVVACLGGLKRRGRRGPYRPSPETAEELPAVLREQIGCLRRREVNGAIDPDQWTMLLPCSAKRRMAMSSAKFATPVVTCDGVGHRPECTFLVLHVRGGAGGVGEPIDHDVQQDAVALFVEEFDATVPR
jgi:hypothetical protein